MRSRSAGDVAAACPSPSAAASSRRRASPGCRRSTRLGLALEQVAPLLRHGSGVVEVLLEEQRGVARVQAVNVGTSHDHSCCSSGRAATRACGSCATATVNPRKRQTAQMSTAANWRRPLPFPIPDATSATASDGRISRKRVPRDPDEADEDRDGRQEAGDRLRRAPTRALVQNLALGVQRSAILSARAARRACSARVDAGGAAVRARRAAARAPANAVVARRRRIRRHANPGRAAAPPRLRLDRIPNHVAEICDGDLEDHHEEDELPEGVRRLHRFSSLPGRDGPDETANPR